MAWARDPRSFAHLQELLGSAFDPDKHRSGVDMAFGLMNYEPRGRIPDRVASIRTSRRPSRRS